MKTLIIFLALIAAVISLPARASTYAPTITARAALADLCPRGGDAAVVGHTVYCDANGVTLYTYTFMGNMTI